MLWARWVGGEKKRLHACGWCPCSSLHNKSSRHPLMCFKWRAYDQKHDSLIAHLLRLLENQEESASRQRCVIAYHFRSLSSLAKLCSSISVLCLLTALINVTKYRRFLQNVPCVEANFQPTLPPMQHALRKSSNPINVKIWHNLAIHRLQHSRNDDSTSNNERCISTGPVNARETLWPSCGLPTYHAPPFSTFQPLSAKRTTQSNVHRIVLEASTQGGCVRFALK